MTPIISDTAWVAKRMANPAPKRTSLAYLCLGFLFGVVTVATLASIGVLP